jgi:autotransporter-associated beta strand protein
VSRALALLLIIRMTDHEFARRNDRLVFDPRRPCSPEKKLAARFRPQMHTLGPVCAAALIIFVLVAATSSLAAQTTISLGAAENVAVLGSSTVTNAGPTTVIGNVALSSPGVSITGFPPGTIIGGAEYIGPGLANQAHADAATAYAQLAGETLTTDLSGQNLGGMILTPGVYHFATAAQLTGTLILNTEGDPNAAFHFQIGTTLTTDPGSMITLLNGNTVNIFWQVGTSATIGVNSTFYGNILADQSITVNSGATINGRAIALNAAVTLSTNTINGFGTGSVWKGDKSNLWSGANWSPDASGATSSTLAPTADVVFSVTGVSPQNQNTVLDLDTTISSLTVNDSAAVTISGSHTLSIDGSGATAGITINSGAGLTTVNSNLVLIGSSQTMTVNNSAGLLINGSVGGTIGLTKAGTGTLTLAGTNTYTGTTTINAGTLNAGAAGSLGGTSNIVVNAGGTLLLSQSGSATNNRINNSSTMTLNGGTFNTAGLSEYELSGVTVTPGIGALTLSSSSIIDLGAGASILAFANSSAQTWSGTLSIYNWSGTPVVGNGIDQLYFGTDSTGLTAQQLSQIAFYSDSGTTFLGSAGFVSGMDGEIGPVPEPATWFAAALVTGTLAWSRRRRFPRSFFGKRKRIAIFMTGAVFVVAFSASANLLEVVPEMGDLGRWTLFSMGNNGLQMSGFTAVQGDVGAAGNGIISIGGHATIDGNLYYRTNSTLLLSDDATITGARYHNRDSELDNGLNEASSASDHAFALAPTRSYTNINLVRNQSITVQGAPGETVVLSLKNFVMQGSTSFTLQGTATTDFIINVRRQFSLSGYAKIVLAGGVQWDNVLFNVRGQGADVLLSSNAHLEGILMANLRTVRLSGQSRIIGEVIAKRIIMSNGSRITHPPVVSPEQPPVQ